MSFSEDLGDFLRFPEFLSRGDGEDEGLAIAIASEADEPHHQFMRFSGSPIQKRLSE